MDDSQVIEQAEEILFEYNCNGYDMDLDDVGFVSDVAGEAIDIDEDVAKKILDMWCVIVG